MAAKGHSTAERISRWDTLINNLEPSINDLPHLVPAFTDLKALVKQARDLGYRQDLLRAQSQENNFTLRDIANRGETIRARLGAGLQSSFGFTSEMLLQFGIRPRRPPVRKKKGDAPTSATVSVDVTNKS